MRGPAIVVATVLAVAACAGTAGAALPVSGARENIADAGGRFLGPFEVAFTAAGTTGVRMRTSREADSSSVLLRPGTTLVQVVLEVQCLGGAASMVSAQRTYRVVKARRGMHRVRVTTLTAACPEGARLGGDSFSGPARGWLCLRRASGAAYGGNEFGGLQTCRRHRATAAPAARG